MRNAIVLFGLVGLSACNVVHAREAGPTTTRSYSVGAFDKLEVAGPYEVVVTSNGQPGVQATGGTNILDEMTVEVDGDTLKIHPKQHHGISFGWHGNGKVQVKVSAAQLREATIAGSGGIAIDKVQGDRFEGTVAGSGSLQLGQLATQDASFSVAGSGGIRAAGTATRAKYEIAGSGDIQAGAVQSQSAKVEIAGSGSVAAHATADAKVEILGSGDVTISGGAKCDIEKHGSGDVRCS